MTLPDVEMTGPADIALLSGTVFTVDESNPWASAVAVRRGRVLAVGSDEEITALCTSSTELLDCQGRLVLPGFVDAHVHPPMGGVESLRCDLTGATTRAAYIDAVGAYGAANPGSDWIRGGGWAMAAFPNGLPEAADLDRVVGNRPVYLPNKDHHSAWVSTRALELAGISASTPDPVDGRIERDAAGRPTGALHEGAMTLVERVLPPLTRADFREGILAAQRYLHSLGITAWQDAWVPLAEGGDRHGELAAYLDLAGSGELTARVVAALWWERDRGEEQIADLLEARQRVDALGSDRLNAGSVKIMQDGVCETFTAAMLTPYLDAHGHETDNCGLSFVEPEALKRSVDRLDEEGFQVHVHAIGDRAVREALDAFEVARRARPATRRHHMAHLQVVHPEDVGRFARLGVTANFQPLWAYSEPQMVELTIPFLGPERSAQQYPIASMMHSGARLAFGSDWPVSTPDPFDEMHVAVRRTEPRDPSTPSSDGDELGREPFLPNERISLGDAVRAFTLGSAYVNDLDAECGSIEAGKAADLVVVDRNVFSTDEADGGIAGGRVLVTMVGGDVVYEAADL